MTKKNGTPSADEELFGVWKVNQPGHSSMKSNMTGNGSKTQKVSEETQAGDQTF